MFSFVVCNICDNARELVIFVPQEAMILSFTSKKNLFLNVKFHSPKEVKGSVISNINIANFFLTNRQL